MISLGHFNSCFLPYTQLSAYPHLPANEYIWIIIGELYMEEISDLVKGILEVELLDLLSVSFFFFHIHVLLNSLLSSPRSCDTSRVLLLLRRINSTCAPLCETEGPFSKRINQLNLFDKKRQKLYWFAFWWSVADISPSCEADAAEKSSIGARDFKTRPLPLIFRSVSREIISSPASLFSPSCETSPNLRGGYL